jgi:hypothetical protein
MMIACIGAMRSDLVVWRALVHIHTQDARVYQIYNDKFWQAQRISRVMMEMICKSWREAAGPRDREDSVVTSVWGDKTAGTPRLGSDKLS